MIIEFNERFKLPASEVYSYFKTPADWTRLYGLAGDPKDLGDGCAEALSAAGGKDEGCSAHPKQNS